MTEMATNLKNRINKKLGKGESDEATGGTTKKSKMSRLKAFQTFLWNPKAGTVLGRTSISWAKISLYYAVFYALLAGFFVLLFGIFASTVSKHLPTFYNTESVMDYKGVNPGLGFRPMESDRSNLLFMGTKEANEFLADQYKTYATTFLTQNDSVSNTINCMENPEKPLERGKVCKYTFTDLIKEDNPCSLSKNGGYLSDEPCVIIKLNRIISWQPTNGTNTFDTTLPNHFVYFNCSGMRASDKDFFPNVTYYSMGTPKGNPNYGSLPYSYFPYYNIYNYVPPFVVVHFKDLKKDFLLNVLCRAYAPNIDNADTLNLRGMTHFQLFSVKST